MRFIKIFLSLFSFILTQMKMHSIRNYLSCRIIFLIFIIIPFIFGCKSFPKEMKEQGMVGWKYESKIKPVEKGTPLFPVTISISDFSRDPSEQKENPGCIVRIIPLVSFAAPPDIIINRIYDGYYNPLDILDGEIENIMLKEIKNSDIFSEISYGGNQKEFIINGTINFIHEWYPHQSGLGIFYGYLIIPMFILPMAKDTYICEFHVEIKPAKGRQVVFTKDYLVKSQYHIFPLYSNPYRQWDEYGNKLFPEIIKQFLNDLKSLPKDAWKKAEGKCISGNCVNGQGTITYPDGSKYSGQWKNNKYNGQGTMTYPDGSKYSGQWKNNKYNGQGIMTYTDGKTYAGQWKDDKDINSYYLDKFMQAAISGDIKELETILNEGINVDIKNAKDYTALLRATYANQYSSVQYLISRKADINITDKQGRTSLIIAAANGYEKIVDLLLENKVNINVKDEKGNTALFYASENGNKTIVEKLLKGGAMPAKMEIRNR